MRDCRRAQEQAILRVARRHACLCCADMELEAYTLRQTAQLHAVDYVILAGYFVTVFAIAIYASGRCRLTRSAPRLYNPATVRLDDTSVHSDSGSDSGGETGSEQALQQHEDSVAATTKDQRRAEKYFLADRAMTWVGVGCSLFMSNIGSEHFIGLAGSGASSGLAVSTFEWFASLTIVVMLGYVFVPRLLKTRIQTLPELLTVRFSAASGRLVACTTIIGAVATKICVTLYSGAIILRVILGWNAAASLSFLLGVTAIYTLIGGLYAVVLTEILQTILLFAGGLPLVVLAFQKVGGWSGVVAYYSNLNMAYKLHLFNRSESTTQEPFPWPGLLFGLVWMEIWYWCTDQVVVQRVLAAKTRLHAQGGCTLCGFFKLFVPFLMVFPGLCARILFADVVESDPNLAYPMMVASILPRGLTGLMVSAMLAALMSSLASTFNSTSSIIVFDFYRAWRPEASGASLVWVGRASTLVLVVVSILWIPIVTHVSDELYVYIQSMISYLAPPIAVVYLAAVLWRRATATASVWTLSMGMVLGLARLILEVVFIALGSPRLFQPLSFFVYANFLYFAILSAGLSIVSMVSISLFSTPTDEAKLARFYGTGEAVGDVDCHPSTQQAEGQHHQLHVSSVSHKPDTFKHPASPLSWVETAVRTLSAALIGCVASVVVHFA
ncbi:Sodium/glucose cotransporter 1 [Porphyridium purpureum]|uniref:Sodium/glucose cotransporter 1 n=1 Tax=Porphyridium purpureum TaxID=35688 RepID=A0A5J4YZZ6_PORPP|nr:Sodium/glucose cotransporter 1 [Porphyridium purpureum]|eukprot:POR4411..scf208_2